MAYIMYTTIVYVLYCISIVLCILRMHKQMYPLVFQFSFARSCAFPKHTHMHTKYIICITKEKSTRQHTKQTT